MYRTFFVFLKCTIQRVPKVDVLLIAFLHLWLKFWEGIDKYWIVPVRQLFYFHHCLSYSARRTRSRRYGKRAFLFCHNVWPSCYGMSQCHSFVILLRGADI